MGQEVGGGEGEEEEQQHRSTDWVARALSQHRLLLYTLQSVECVSTNN